MLFLYVFVCFFFFMWSHLEIVGWKNDCFCLFLSLVVFDCLVFKYEFFPEFQLFTVVVVWPLLWTCHLDYLCQAVSKSRLTFESWDRSHQIWLSGSFAFYFFSCLYIFNIDVNQYIHQTPTWKSIYQRICTSYFNKWQRRNLIKYKL